MDEQERGASESSFASQRPTIADTALREVLLSLGYSLISINWRAKPLTSLEGV